jgi:tungstate transport system substrate-binding protein
MLEKRDAHVAITHAPEAEAETLRRHADWRYRKLMFNDFVLVGPDSDPARVRQAGGVEDAMRRIAGSSATFVSRGDRSGTHEREELLWTLAAAQPPPGRLVAAGAGMGTTLRIAAETGAYTLTDRATWAQGGRQPLTILFEGSPRLLNTYAVILDPGGPRAELAAAFADWLTDGDGRTVIDGFRIGGVRAFSAWPAGAPRHDPLGVPR